VAFSAQQLELTVDALGDSVSVTLTSPPRGLGSLPPKVEARALAFVSRNLGALIEHWNGENDTGEVIERLQRV
jgi:hypothetical protein